MVNWPADMPPRLYRWPFPMPPYPPALLDTTLFSALTRLELIAGQNAIKYGIISHRWEQAYEPGHGPENGMVGFWCDAPERIDFRNPNDNDASDYDGSVSESSVNLVFILF
ncbi:uncharacterized protein N7500_005867 [Penicillium coprophilum]|uniref:uncharacterized protein n=1 Tax=Penicillium coprophilum TaxID=36646 RepID=UPI00238985A4|nr:uncharacterized protein N7500_005867 [Penicillium coprophilum]KAJ5164037.1 hypothetical protein N7500_005867 [Penicillium coprophilum]